MRTSSSARQQRAEPFLALHEVSCAQIGVSLFIDEHSDMEEEMSKALRLTITFLLGGCAGEEPPLTSFKKISNTEFTFEARTDPLEYPEDDPKTEATHMDWLKQELAKRNLCPNGFTIKDRTEIAAREESVGQTHNMAYHGVCK